MGEGNFLWSKEGSARRHRRTHGLQMPLHPQQVIGWVVMVLVIALMYGALIPALHTDFIAPVAAASATFFLAHIICHAAALAIDPAHPRLRERKYKVLIPEFDRSVHSHVIENGRCHVCNITITSSRTKHCSACNKCVDVFDHHCKWLNNCIGQRNYRIFLATVITAILSCIVVMATCVAEIIFYYFNRPYLAPWDDQVTSISSVAPVEESGSVLCQKGDRYCHFSVFGVYLYDGPFIGIVSILFFVTLVATVLLVHLIVFHCYLLFIGLTTFEYIRGTHGSPVRSYSRRKEVGARDGVTCSWNSRKINNQITPSSTTDSALIPSPDTPNTTTTSIGTVSPRSNPSTPADDNRLLLGGRHQMIHHKQPLSPRSLSTGGTATQSNFPVASFPSKPSSVPSLPKIPGAKNCSSLQTISKNVTNSKGSSNNSFEDDPDLTYHLVSVPRPNRPSRRRIKSSVVPHLSPIKECDNSSTSPPSIRSFTPCSSRSYDFTSNLSSETKRLTSPRKSSKCSKTKGLFKVVSRDQSSVSKYSSVPSPNKRKSPKRSSHKSPKHSSPMKKSSSFGGTSSNRVATPTLRLKLPKEGLTNGHIVKSSPASIIDTSNGNVVSNGQLLSIVKSRSEGLLIKMGDMNKGGVYLGPHKKDPFIVTTGTSKINKSNGKALIEHHM